MREILFRGFHPDGNGSKTITLNGEKIRGEWVYGFPVIDNVDCVAKREGKCICKHDGTEVYMLCWCDECHEFDYYGDIVAETVGQYIGLDDKDGNKIFKDDIIGVHQFLFDGNEYEKELIGTVVWDDECMCWAVDKIEHSEIQKYMGYDNISQFAKEKVSICMLYGLHEESYRLIGNKWEVEE